MWYEICVSLENCAEAEREDAPRLKTSLGSSGSAKSPFHQGGEEDEEDEPGGVMTEKPAF